MTLTPYSYGGDGRSVIGSDIRFIEVTFDTSHLDMSPNVKECEPSADATGKTGRPAIRCRSVSMGSLLGRFGMMKGRISGLRVGTRDKGNQKVDGSDQGVIRGNGLALKAKPQVAEW